MTIARTRVTRRIGKPFRRRVLWGHRPSEASDELAAQIACKGVPVPASLPHEVAKQSIPAAVRRRKRWCGGSGASTPPRPPGATN